MRIAKGPNASNGIPNNADQSPIRNATNIVPTRVQNQDANEKVSLCDGYGYACRVTHRWDKNPTAYNGHHDGDNHPNAKYNGNMAAAYQVVTFFA